MAEVIGRTLVKIDGLYHLDVTNARWSDKRAVTQHVTGAGIDFAVGEEMPSGSFDQVIPRERDFDWRARKNFSVDIYDKETRTVVVASFSGCNWNGVDGSSDLSSAMAKKAIGWVGSGVNKI